MHHGSVFAVALLSALAAAAPSAAECLPTPPHKPLAMQHGPRPDARARLVAVAEVAAPERPVRTARVPLCLNALCPNYVVLGTSY